VYVPDNVSGILNKTALKHDPPEFFDEDRTSSGCRAERSGKKCVGFFMNLRSRLRAAAEEKMLH
jgi:hypothetical protein